MRAARKKLNQQRRWDRLAGKLPAELNGNQRRSLAAAVREGHLYIDMVGLIQVKR